MNFKSNFHNYLNFKKDHKQLEEKTYLAGCGQWMEAEDLAESWLAITVNAMKLVYHLEQHAIKDKEDHVRDEGLPILCNGSQSTVGERDNYATAKE